MASILSRSQYVKDRIYTTLLYPIALLIPVYLQGIDESVHKVHWQQSLWCNSSRYGLQKDPP